MKAHALRTELRNGESIFSKSNCDAVLFDLDGVITTTEKIHSACWKKTFDEFLRARAGKRDGNFVPFSETDDYLEHVDGKPRYEGVRGFLLSRAIELPEGSADSPPGEQSVFGLGNRKNQLFTEILEKEPPGIYRTSVALARRLKEAGFRLAVVSSSRNCRAVMAAAGIENLFEVTVDGGNGIRKRSSRETGTRHVYRSRLGSRNRAREEYRHRGRGGGSGGGGKRGFRAGNRRSQEAERR